MHQQAAAGWALQQFDGVEVGDVRRSRRVVHIAEALATSPGRSLPQLFATVYELKAAYTLFRRLEATPERQCSTADASARPSYVSAAGPEQCLCDVRLVSAPRSEDAESRRH